ncbi:MAG: hypothetical protein HY474_01935 [Candidatus Sungbacteria bacterium]|uniref:HTH deoR-type domain-containing protein n=1 Tax=Candidatus Sungiibacteriota bacterium TaxID=2750080 RepID=A0A933DSZ9_9BACT|nr:hypothetical protein [Candidatus Sungbacteria bacterium]
MSDADALQEARRKALAAAEAIYRLTGFAAFDSALKHSLRRHATEILGGVTGMAFFTEVRRSNERERLTALIAGAVEIIRFTERSCLITAGNAGRVIAAYGAVSDGLRAIPEGNNDLAATDSLPSRALFTPNERQSRILTYLSGNGRAQLGDIRQIFGDTYSEKTLQRDLLQLVSAGFIQRQGDNRWTVYSI